MLFTMNLTEKNRTKLSIHDYFFGKIKKTIMAFFCYEYLKSYLNFWLFS